MAKEFAWKEASDKAALYKSTISTTLFLVLSSIPFVSMGYGFGRAIAWIGMTWALFNEFFFFSDLNESDNFFLSRDSYPNDVQWNLAMDKYTSSHSNKVYSIFYMKFYTVAGDLFLALLTFSTIFTLFDLAKVASQAWGVVEDLDNLS